MNSFWKGILTLFILLLLFDVSYSQSFRPSDLIQQNKKQRKLLLEQITANNAYLKLLKKGNNILDFGLKFLGLSKENDFYLHADFFARLKTVNPLMVKSGIVKQVMSEFVVCRKMEERIGSLIRENDEFLKKNKVELSEFLNEIRSVIEKEYLSFELTLYDDALNMNDASRIEIINEIHKRLLRLRRSIVIAEKGIAGLIAVRKRLGLDGEVLRGLLDAEH